MGAPGVERVPDDYAPGPQQALADAVGYLTGMRPFHAHEVLEGRWKCCPQEERELWQGLAQICVGLTHLQRGNIRGAATLLGRGADRVAHYGHGAYGVDLGDVVRVARDLAEHPATDPGAAITRVAATLGA